MALSFAWMFAYAKPNGKELIVGLLVPKLSSKTVRQAVGVVGCVTMPHNVIEQVEVKYVPEKAEFDGHLDEEFRKVFEKFNFKEIVGSEENDKKDETAADSTSKKVDSNSEEEEQDTHQTGCLLHCKGSDKWHGKAKKKTLPPRKTLKL